MTNTQDAGAREATVDESWRCQQWLYREAVFLDNNKLHDWLELLTPDIDYRLPIRVTRERAQGAGHSEDGYHLWEDRASLAARVDRLDGEFAWAENPPSRIRRIVSNVLVDVEADGSYLVSSSFALYRSRMADTAYELLVGERQDQLVEVDGRLKLRRRLILLDHTTVASKNLAIFF